MSQRQLFLTLKTETPPLWDVLGTAGYLQKSHCHGENRNLVICDIHIFSSPKEARKIHLIYLQCIWKWEGRSPVPVGPHPRLMEQAKGRLTSFSLCRRVHSSTVTQEWPKKKNKNYFIPYLLEECSVYRREGPEPNSSPASWIPKSSMAVWDYTTGKIKLMQILGLAGCEASK